jgi:hypothetical protein
LLVRFEFLEPRHKKYDESEKTVCKSCGMKNNPAMSTPVSERRLAPRFSIHGPVAVRFPGSDTPEFSSAIMDISLNGALLGIHSVTELQLAELKTGAVVELELSLQGVPHVVARAMVAHVRADRFGVEFSDMETRDFDVFAGLVLMLEQRNRINLIDAA